MSRIKVDEIVDFAETGPVTAIEGLTVSSGKKFRVLGVRTITNANDTGEEGEICWDANYIYVCVGTDTWRRVAIATW